MLRERTRGPDYCTSFNRAVKKLLGELYEKSEGLQSCFSTPRMFGPMTGGLYKEAFNCFAHVGGSRLNYSYDEKIGSIYKGNTHRVNIIEKRGGCS
jgi:hypothetical protein